MNGPELLASLGSLFGPKIQGKTEFRGETSFTILAADLREVAKILPRRTFLRLPARYHERG